MANTKKLNNCEEGSELSQGQINQLFDLMGLSTEEARTKILSQGKMYDYSIETSSPYEVWISPNTFNDEKEGKELCQIGTRC